MAQAHEELLTQLQQGPDALHQAIEGLSQEELLYRRSPDKWSIKQICIHLSDTEIAVAFRIRNMLAEDKPVLQPFDQDVWANALQYESQDLALAMQQFAMLRQANVALLQTISAEDWQRAAVHPNMGEITLEKLVTIYSNHVYKHIGQIEENLAHYRSR